MGCDLFNNSNGGYINPGLSPCAGTGENNNLEFVDKGIGIVSGSEVKSFMDFSDLSIPVDSWNQQIQSLGPGEVIFIQGLTKGLTERHQGYIIPTLNSTNEALNPFFMEIDLSINYYYNFAFIEGAIDVSSNYANNIDIATAINLEFTDSNIKINSSYDPSSLLFIGSQEGYQFDISSVYLSVIDASQDLNSPFPPYIVDGQRVQQIWKLEENLNLNIPSSKYPNTASQGIILKTKYPSDAEGNYICDVDKWIYVNHAANTVDICDEIELTFNTDVSCGISIAYDNSTFLGIKPFIPDISIFSDISLGYPDIIPDISILDGSTELPPNLIIDNSILSNLKILNSNITDSSIVNPGPTSIYNSNISYTGSSEIINAYLIDSSLSNLSLGTSVTCVSSLIIDSSIFGFNYIDSDIINTVSISGGLLENLLRTDVSGGEIQLGPGSGHILLDGSNNIFHDVSIGGGGAFFAISFNKYDIYNLNPYDITIFFLGGFFNSNIWNVNLNKSIHIVQIRIKDSSVINSSFMNPQIENSYIEDTSISSSGTSYAEIYNSEIINIRNEGFLEARIRDSGIYNSSLNGIETEDASIEASYISLSIINKSYIIDSSIHDSIITNSEFILSSIFDSSIVDSVFNNATKVSNSIINNSWSNVFVLVTNPSTGEKIYVMNDPTLAVDSSAWRVNIDNTLIWDSSFNNTTIYDSSIYRTYFQDSSLIRCTTYNCTFDESVEYDTRTIMIDASITSDSSISFDTSIFYTKTTKNVEVGLSGCSSDESISAGDYLNWVTTNDLWKKIGDLYAWTSAPDDSNSNNLIPGFYVYNAHTFPVSIEYMVFV